MGGDDSKQASTSTELTWTAEAGDRVEKIPSFMRPMIKMGVEKKGGLCPECDTLVPLFEGGCEDICTELDLPLLAKIPFDRQLAKACDSGIPLAEKHPISIQFDDVVNHIHEFLESKKTLVT